MQLPVLKSSEFRREREQNWRDLEALVERLDRGGLKALTADELLRLPELYRCALSSLSVARNVSLDRGLLSYLESLTTRAFFHVYGGRSDPLHHCLRFLTHGFPRAVRGLRLSLAVAILTLLLGGLASFSVTLDNMDWYYTFVSDGIASGRTPTSDPADLHAGLYRSDGTPEEWLNAFSAYLFSHNARIGLLAFALGFLFAAPTLLLLFSNGLGLGAFAALYHSHGLSADLWGWLLVHGSTELLAIALAGAAGIKVGASLAFPGQHSRMVAAARAGRSAAVVAVGCVLMFVIAAALEGFARQLVTDVGMRYAIAIAMLAVWCLYFTLPARGDESN